MTWVRAWSETNSVCQTVVDEVLFGNQLAGGEGEDGENIHGAWAQPNLPTVVRDSVEGWLHHPVTEVEWASEWTFHVVASERIHKSIC